VLAPGELTGEEGRGEDYCEFKSARILCGFLKGNWPSGVVVSWN
jgi:hypothetical protein